MLSDLFSRPFRVIHSEESPDGEAYLLIVRVDGKTAHRAANMLGAGESPEELARVVADALNLHAMPGLLRSAGG